MVGCRDRRQTSAARARSGSWRRRRAARTGRWRRRAADCAASRSTAAPWPWHGRHVDQIDVVAHLGDRRTADDPVQRRGDVLRGDAKLARLVLQHVDLDDARRFVPVEDHVAEHAGCRQRRCASSLRMLAHLADIRTADTVLHRPSDRRTDIEQLHDRHRCRERSSSDSPAVRPQPIAHLQALGDDDRSGRTTVSGGCTSKESTKRGAPCPT